MLAWPLRWEVANLLQIGIERIERRRHVEPKVEITGTVNADRGPQLLYSQHSSFRLGRGRTALSGFARASRTNTSVHLVTTHTRPRPAHPCLDRLEACVGAAITETVGVSITQYSMPTTRHHWHEPKKTSKGPTINPMTRIKKNYCNKNQYCIFWHPPNQGCPLGARFLRDGDQMPTHRTPRRLPWPQP